MDLSKPWTVTVRMQRGEVKKIGRSLRSLCVLFDPICVVVKRPFCKRVEVERPETDRRKQGADFRSLRALLS
jgi:hypothetical protein